MITAHKLEKRYGGTTILHRVDLHVQQGCFYGIIGPNGSGKSTLLKLLSGVETPDHGDVILEGKPLQSYTRKETARRMAVLQQEGLPPLSYTVREVIEMGRYPFQHWLGGEENDPEAVIQLVMDQLDLHPMAERPVSELSGGERQRVALAKTMVQEPRVLLLDEPTTFLDIGYQIQMMDYIRKWQKDCGLTVIAVLHDLNLAAQYCEHLLVLHQGKIAGSGTPAEVLTANLIQEVYGTEPIVLSHPESGVPQILLQPASRSALSE